MKKILSITAFFAFTAVTLFSQPDSVMIFDFENNTDFYNESIKQYDATSEITNIDGNKLLKVYSGFTIREPGVKLLRNNTTNWNLTGYYMVKADVSNLSDKEIQVELFVGNDPDGLVRWFCSDYIDLKPGQSGTITVPLAWTPWIFKPQLTVEGVRGVHGKLKCNDLGTIDEFTFCTRYETTPSVFTVDNIRAIGKLEYKDTTGFFPFIDMYGQYKHEDWKGKVKTTNDIIKQKQDELADIDKNKSPESLGLYGGWAGGPKLEATGYFRTEKYNNKWWMVDPEGYLFWTAGLNCVSSWSVATGVEYREKYFESVPYNDPDYKDFFSKSTWASMGFYNGKAPYKAYNFHQANLYRKYGKEWVEEYRKQAHIRLRSWGLNTIGFMSDFQMALQHKTPYVGSIWIHNTPKIEASEGYWGKFHDVFDPEFRSNVRKSMERQKTGAGDPWCIGFFVDNELSWGLIGSLSVATLKSPATQPAKKEFINDLEAKYKAIDKLNAQWGTNHESWITLLNNTTAPDEERAKDDLYAFYEKTAMTYFQILHDELERIAPNQNYLGCRFAWANNYLTLSAAAKYCDIVSFNKYEFGVEKVKLPEGVDAPIMIGEFHFGSTDRGMAHPGVKIVATQEERGIAYEKYIKGALRNEQIVGAHWFQYLDQPYTGRGDGENYNVGLVDVTDKPHQELIDKIRETCYNMYEYRLGN